MRGGIQSGYNTDMIRRMLMKRRGGGQEEDRNVKKGGLWRFRRMIRRGSRGVLTELNRCSPIQYTVSLMVIVVRTRKLSAMSSAHLKLRID